MTSAFAAALENGDLDALRRAPKSDLHNHGVAGASRAFMREQTGVDIAPLDRTLTSMAQMDAWFRAQVGTLFDDAAGRLLGFEGTFAQAQADGVTRLSCGEDVWAITLNRSATALIGDLKGARRAVAPDVEWLPQLGMSRHCSIGALERWLAPFLELEDFDSIDLSGDEFGQPIERFAPLYRMAKQRGLRLKAHVGEWGSADDVWRAVEVLELHEVQHGIAAAASPAVMRMLADNAIRLNICPTSNVRLGRVESLASHPIRALHDAGVPVTINTDDVLVFGASVSEEYLGLFRAGVFTAAELDDIRMAGLA